MATERDSAIVILFMCLTALCLALVAEHGFGLQPCQLCLYQRIPYAVAAALALPILGIRLPRGLRALLLAACALTFLVGGVLALFHVGVEQHWWAGPTSCSGGAGGARTVEELIAKLNQPIAVPSCDQVAWSLFGISMAGYNVLASLGLAGFAGLAARRSGERRR